MVVQIVQTKINAVFTITAGFIQWHPFCNFHSMIVRAGYMW
jgi:hypothetical protein